MANKRAFVDTNGLLALLNRDDPLFPEAESRWRELGQTGYSLILTDWVIAETGNGLAQHRCAWNLLRLLIGSAGVLV